VLRHEPAGPEEPDLTLFGLLSDVLRERDAHGTTMPMLPMQLPRELGFLRLLHAADERLPADAMEFGTDAIQAVLERYGH
jgi:hypothetical protein